MWTTTEFDYTFCSTSCSVDDLSEHKKETVYILSNIGRKEVHINFPFVMNITNYLHYKMVVRKFDRTYI